MDTTLKKWPLILKRYVEYNQSIALSHHSIVNYLCDIRCFFSFLEEENIEDLKDIDRKVISKYQSFIYSHPRGYKLRTQSKKITGVRNFFSFLDHEDYVLNDPSREIDLPKIPKELPLNVPTEDEMTKLIGKINIDSLLGLRNRAILELLYSTGIRSGELAALKLSSIDKDRGFLRIIKGKGSKDRVVPIGDLALKYIDLYLTHERPRLLKRRDYPHLFITRRGKPVHQEDVPEIVQRCARDTGIKRRITAHMIRHACATHMLRRSAPIRYIQELLGHGSLATTQLYTKVEIKDLKKIHHKTHPREIS